MKRIYFASSTSRVGGRLEGEAMGVRSRLERLEAAADTPTARTRRALESLASRILRRLEAEGRPSTHERVVAALINYRPEVGRYFENGGALR